MINFDEKDENVPSQNATPTMQNGVAQRVEELLRELLADMGIDVANLAPHEIAESMHCNVYPDESMLYSWNNMPLLRVVPEKDENGNVMRWRMFTGDDSVEQ